MTGAFAAELRGSRVRVESIEPRAAMMSEGDEALIGSTIADDLIQSAPRRSPTHGWVRPT